MIKHVGSVTPNKIILLLLSPLLLSASLLDFQALEKAKEGYAEGNYSKAIEAYDAIEKKSDELIYDEANSHYKLKEYEKAKELYSSITKDSLAFQKWHNLGNCYAQLGKLDEGIEAYEKALKIKEDKATRFNLELLKKKKKEQEQKKKNNKNKKNDKNKKDNKDNKKSDKQKNKDEKKKQDKKNSDKDKKSDKQKKEDEKKKKEQDKKDKEQKDKKSDEKKKGEKNKDKQKAQMKKEPISDKEVRKYQKMLDQRGINTLMVPLKTKGEDNHELKPW